MARMFWVVVVAGLAGCGLTPVAEASCTDRALNGDESDVDCGGAACGPCADARACRSWSDCVSMACTAGRCTSVEPCADGTKNGEETAVDCGGAACPRCGDGLTCRANADCASSNCGSGFLCLPAAGSCVDGVHNGGESDRDCGGPLCPRCLAGARCGVGLDCLEGLCTQGTCAARPSCTDRARNGDESDVDCGGSTCARCQAGARCDGAGDCATGVCLSQVCQAPPSCADRARNGDESDVDCGGSMCARCQAGARCAGAGDCATGLCLSQVCQPQPSCTNRVRDGDESDVDCGGSLCARCELGARCAAPRDCFSGLCESLVCAPPPTCTDGQRNGDEADVDCGGPICPRCALGKVCRVGSDCGSGTCSDQLLWTDASWRFTASTPAAAWTTAAFDDSGWARAVSQGAHGSGPPWGASPPMPPQTRAEWIWSYDSRNGFDTSTLSFRKTFVVPPSPITVHVAADDSATVRLNGTVISTTSIWFTPGVATVSNLVPGTTAVLAITAVNGGGAGGLVADLRTTSAWCTP